MKKRLSVLAVNDPAVSVYVDPTYKILQSFEEAFDTEVSFDIVDFDQYYETLMDVFEGKKHADIVMVAGHFWLKDFVSHDYLVPLAFPNDPKYDSNDILPVVRQEMMIDGVTYLFPSFCDGHIICYRKSFVNKVLKENFPEVLTTQEYIEILKQLSRDKEYKGVAYRASASEIFLDALPYLRSNGIEVFDANGKFHYDKEKMIKALNEYFSLKQLTTNEMSSYGNNEVVHDIQKNIASVAVSWGGQLGVILNEHCLEKNDLGFSTFKTSWNVTWSFGVTKCADVELSKKLLEYLTSKEVDRIVGGYAGSPVRKSTYISDSEKYPWYSLHLKLVEQYAKPLPSITHAGEFLGVFYKLIYQAYINEISIETAALRIENDIMSILEGSLQ